MSEKGALVPIFKGNCDVRDCYVHRIVKLCKNAIKIVKRVLEFLLMQRNYVRGKMGWKF